MGFARERPGVDGTVRYAAIYRGLKGRQRSAGTFATERQADKAWQRAEAVIGLGRVGDPRRGRQTFQRYVEDTWLPNHEIEASTRQRYTYSLYLHIVPEFWPMRMIDILPEHVREWVAILKARGVSPSTIADNKVILSAIFTTALNDQVTFLHPCKGVKTPHVPVKPRTIITPEQFGRIYAALPDADAQLLVETEIESGLRWGELTELRVRDLDFGSRLLTVSRAVVEVHPRFHPDGGRFLVKEYPKDREYRRFKLSEQIATKLSAHIIERDLGPDDLPFRARSEEGPRARKLRLVADPASLGRTEPNAAGRRYPSRHYHRLFARPLPLRLLPGRLRPVPCGAAGRGQGCPPPGQRVLSPPRPKRLDAPGPRRPPIWPGATSPLHGRPSPCLPRQARATRRARFTRGRPSGPGQAGDVEGEPPATIVENDDGPGAMTHAPRTRRAGRMPRVRTTPFRGSRVAIGDSAAAAALSSSRWANTSESYRG